MNNLKQMRVFEWSLGALTVLLATIAWLQQVQPSNNPLTVYDLFPLLGLIAFGLMWTHFMIGAVVKASGIHYERGYYSIITMGLVLALIIMHPTLLTYGLYRDGLGIPPGSFMQVYGADFAAIIIGELSLTLFLAYELKVKFGKRSWWKYIEAVQGAAMIGIFYHALTLGGTLQQVAWFRAVWWIYGVLLVISIVYAWHKQRKGVQSEIKS